MSNSRDYKLEAFGALLDVLDELRIKCPWDAKQTNESLRPNTIEEAMELADALINNSVSDIEKELGDVLLHIIFYAKIADEKGQFDIADVCDALRKKLIFRHPHVFGTTHVDNTDQVLQNWEQLKLKECACRCAQFAAEPYQGVPDTGKSCKCGLRLGFAGTSMGQGEGRNCRSGA